MAKKGKNISVSKPKQEMKETGNSLSDLLGEDVLAKLKDTKQILAAADEQKKEEERVKRIQERKEREKNKSFEELLEEYGDQGAKY
ncbi:YqkE family protein [Sporosarcina sp.]|uniref:YqkE family protein n=1 Tax=Sporosarcina sp. TaxID=49982 RepID=UPI002618D2D4|nr:YqkE family protein [Sporosarcina sp.]